MDLREIVSGIGASDALAGVAQKLNLNPSQAEAALHGVLDHVTQGQPLDGLIDSVAGKAGIDPSQVQQFLPHVMGLLQGHADNANEGVQDMLGGLMNSLQNSGGGGLLASLENQAGNGLAGAIGGLFHKA